MAELGRVVALWRYPVKAMAGESLSHADVSWHGIAGDRRWAFVRGDVPRSGFPWLTIRQRPDLVRFAPFFAEPDRPDDSVTLVRTPAGDEYDVVDPALAALLGAGVRAIKQDRGVFDSAPLSLITTSSIAGIAPALDPRRFRPNLLIETAADEPFPEDAWVGATLAIGGLRMRIDRRDERCAVVGVDPDSGERNPIVLRTIGRIRQACLGVYATPVVPGRVAVGDTVLIARE